MGRTDHRVRREGYTVPCEETEKDSGTRPHHGTGHFTPLEDDVYEGGKTAPPSVFVLNCNHLKENVTKVRS